MRARPVRDAPHEHLHAALRVCRDFTCRRAVWRGHAPVWHAHSPMTRRSHPPASLKACLLSLPSHPRREASGRAPWQSTLPGLRGTRAARDPRGRGRPRRLQRRLVPARSGPAVPGAGTRRGPPQSPARTGRPHHRHGRQTETQGTARPVRTRRHHPRAQRRQHPRTGIHPGHRRLPEQRGRRETQTEGRPHARPAHLRRRRTRPRGPARSGPHRHQHPRPPVRVVPARRGPRRAVPRRARRTLRAGVGRHPQLSREIL